MTSFNALTIDLQSRPQLEFRIDAFMVPAGSRAEFEALMHRNAAFIATLPGFMHHLVFERATDSPTAYDIVTIAVWADRAAIVGARAEVRAYYQRIGFDMAAAFDRLGLPHHSATIAREGATHRSTTSAKEERMQPVTVINKMAIKPGKMDEFIDAQQRYSAALTTKPNGLIGSRMYRSLDGKSVVLVSQFESMKAQEDIRQTDAFKENLRALQALVESSNPDVYEMAYANGNLE